MATDEIKVARGRNGFPAEENDWLKKRNQKNAEGEGGTSVAVDQETDLRRFWGMIGDMRFLVGEDDCGRVDLGDESDPANLTVSFLAFCGTRELSVFLHLDGERFAREFDVVDRGGRVRVVGDREQLSPEKEAEYLKRILDVGSSVGPAFVRRNDRRYPIVWPPVRSADRNPEEKVKAEPEILTIGLDDEGGNARPLYKRQLSALDERIRTVCDAGDRWYSLELPGKLNDKNVGVNVFDARYGVPHYMNLIVGGDEYLVSIGYGGTVAVYKDQQQVAEDETVKAVELVMGLVATGGLQAKIGKMIGFVYKEWQPVKFVEKPEAAGIINKLKVRESDDLIVEALLTAEERNAARIMRAMVEAGKGLDLKVDERLVTIEVRGDDGKEMVYYSPGADYRKPRTAILILKSERGKVRCEWDFEGRKVDISVEKGEPGQVWDDVRNVALGVGDVGATAQVSGGGRRWREETYDAIWEGVSLED